MIAVIGGGIAGVTVAWHLAARGVPVTLYEAGTAAPGPERRDTGGPLLDRQWLVPPDDPQWRCAATAQQFEWLRVRALGGRGRLWGGWCARPNPQDFSSAEWRDAFPALQSGLTRAEQWLACGMRPLPDFAARCRSVLNVALQPQLHATRDFAAPMGWSDWSDKITIHSDTIVTHIAAKNNGYELTCHAAGNPQTVTASRVVLASSALETVRLLWNLESPQTLCWRESLGHGLSDHIRLSMMCLCEQSVSDDLQPPAGWMPAGTFSALPRWFFELRGPWPATILSARDQQRLHLDQPARHAVYMLHGMGAAVQHPLRRMTLDAHETDALGRPLIQVAWDWQPDERADIERAMAQLQQCAAMLADQQQHRCIVVRDPYRPGGIGHEAGGAVMHPSDPHAVCELDGAVRGAPGLYVADTARWPSPLTCYPTLTLVAMAQQLADTIAAAG